MNRTLVLLKNNLAEVPSSKKAKCKSQMIGTVLSNLAYYGYVPSKQLAKQLIDSGDEVLTKWWTAIETELKFITGASKNMDKFVVYKNFPKEVLEKSHAEYWFSQILMYIGLPNDLFTETEVVRDQMFEKIKLKVIHLAQKDSLQKIASELALQPSRWTVDQFNTIKYLVENETVDVDYAVIPFKENLAKLVAELVKSENINVTLKSATDVLRLAVALVGGDVTLKTNTKFAKISRPTRRFLLKILNKTDMEEDFARRPEQWKRLLRALRPNDYGTKFANVCKAYNKLYNDQIQTFNSKVEDMLSNEDKKVIALLSHRPGEFVRRLHHVSDIFGKGVSTAFGKVLPNLKTIQLLKMQKYLETINDRNYRIFPPKGNWTKAQIVANDRKIKDPVRMSILKRIGDEIGERVSKTVGSVKLDESTKMVKIQTSDNELTNYGRGTVFPIPDDVTFIRTASYWKCKTGYNSWFDVGWNFFDKDWNPMGACCWNHPYFNGKNDNAFRYWGTSRKPSDASAVFSGDPTNSKELEGRACQMIDLYLDKLEEQGVRYAVWNILCFSRIKFKDAEEVYGAMQWGVDPQKGKLFEPSRCQLSFPVGGDTFTKYIAYVDVKKRNVVYMDANFKASTSSAGQNGENLQKMMPAFIEYMDALPSVYDVFKNGKKSAKGIPVVYDDSGISIDGGKAFVFKPRNEKNKFDQIELSKIIS